MEEGGREEGRAEIEAVSNTECSAVTQTLLHVHVHPPTTHTHTHTPLVISSNSSCTVVLAKGVTPMSIS